MCRTSPEQGDVLPQNFLEILSRVLLNFWDSPTSNSTAPSFEPMLRQMLSICGPTTFAST
jgi:hypothetical protein